MGIRWEARLPPQSFPSRPKKIDAKFKFIFLRNKLSLDQGEPNSARNFMYFLLLEYINIFGYESIILHELFQKPI